METALFTLLFLALVVLCGEAASERGGRVIPWLGISALALGLTRPEGNLAAAIALGVAIALAPRGRRQRILISTLIGYLAPAAGYFLGRWHFYGELLPLPFYVKLAHQHGFPGAPPV